MTDVHDPTWNLLAQCACWEHHQFADGPLAHGLMHLVVDPAGLLRGDDRGVARASVRLVLRDGPTFALVVRAPRTRMLDVLQLAGAALAGQRYEESVFSALDAAMASALLAAGMQKVRGTLEHNATLLPRPLLPPDQIGGMALHAANAARRAQGATALAACPAQWLGQLRQACAVDDPAVLAFVAALDPHALAYRASAREVHGVALDRLAVYNFAVGAHHQSRNRTQALQALPWLLPLMTAQDGSGKWEGVRLICRAIDDGLPLHDAVAQAFGVPREVVRWLGRRALPGNWRFDVRRLQRLLALLAWLPPERRPRSALQFEALTALGSALAAPFEYRGRAEDPVALARIAGCMRQWLGRATLGRTDDTLTNAGIVRRARELEDARDFLRALFDAARAIDGLDVDSADAWVLRWCAGIGMTRMLSLSQAWHMAVTGAQHDDTDGSDSSGTRWPAVLATPWHGKHRTAIELTSRDALHIEGQKMGHCVGSYEAVCRSGNSVIVSLRTAAGVPMSTAQLQLSDAVPAIQAAQHRAAHNALPDADCVQALAALLRDLNRADQGPVLRRRAFQRRQREKQVRQDGGAGCEGFTFSVAAQLAARRLATPPVAGSATLALCE